MAAGTAGAELQTESTSPVISRTRVLLISANELSNTAHIALEKVGYQVRGVRKPSDAAAVAQSWTPHAVVFEGPIAALEGIGARGLVRQVLAAHRCISVLAVDECTSDALARAIDYNVDAVVPRESLAVDMERVLTLGAPAPAGTTITAEPPVIEDLIGGSPAMREVWQLVARTALLGSSVLITGETGVGKEVVARVMHRLSSRKHGPFVAVNCAALPDTLLESELFGHEKGAFTGAAARHTGRFELADNGTLLLDEIGELPPSVQVKLLRVLQERAFERVGGTRPVAVDVRILAATNRDLEAEAERGTFRSDLLYRLNTLVIRVPSLRERTSDILPLWDHFTQRAAASSGRTTNIATGLDAKRVLLGYQWPGNVRELQNAAGRAVALAGGPTITAKDLPDAVQGAGDRAPAQHLHLAGLSLAELERAAILTTFEALGNARDAAGVLGISLRKFYYRLKEYRALSAVGQHASATSPEVAALAAPSTRDDRSRRVVLAEDDEDVRTALADLLRDEGYDVIVVSNGADALQHVGAALTAGSVLPIDALITDVQMPGVNGMRLLEGLRAMGSKVPVIVITAFGDAETRENARRLGASAVLDKPIDVEQLVATLEGASPATAA
jgi:DNA-binding NtrC family response regulator